MKRVWPFLFVLLAAVFSLTISPASAQAEEPAKIVGEVEITGIIEATPEKLPLALSCASAIQGKELAEAVCSPFFDGRPVRGQCEIYSLDSKVPRAEFPRELKQGQSFCKASATQSFLVIFRFEGREVCQKWLPKKTPSLQGCTLQDLVSRPGVSFRPQKVQ